MLTDPKDAATSFHYAWKTNGMADKFKTGVSLHSHTWNSFESLSFLPGITEKVSPLRKIMEWVERRYERKWHEPFDYTKGYWTSPVSPDVAFDLEAHQIQKQGLHPLVSITDHDIISGCEELRSKNHAGGSDAGDGVFPVVPISVEWTAPYKGAVLHIGVHNLPAADGAAIAEQLQKYTAEPTPHALHELLVKINDFPDALLILNHPLSDQGRIGFEIHSSLVKDFLKENAGLVHALEVNALQSWDINRRVGKIATEVSLPIISGGDRHGFEPNGVINLTNAKTFPEFVHEIRHDKKSDVLFMLQCRKSLIHRYSENVKRMFDEYPELPGRRFWYDRVFYECPDGVTRPISQMFNVRNRALKATDVFMGFVGLANRIVRPISSSLAESNQSMK